MIPSSHLSVRAGAVLLLLFGCLPASVTRAEEEAAAAPRLRLEKDRSLAFRHVYRVDDLGELGPSRRAEVFDFTLTPQAPESDGAWRVRWTFDRYQLYLSEDETEPAVEYDSARPARESLFLEIDGDFGRIPPFLLHGLSVDIVLGPDGAVRSVADTAAALKTAGASTSIRGEDRERLVEELEPDQLQTLCARLLAQGTGWNGASPDDAEVLVANLDYGAIFLRLGRSVAAEERGEATVERTMTATGTPRYGEEDDPEFDEFLATRPADWGRRDVVSLRDGLTVTSTSFTALLPFVWEVAGEPSTRALASTFRRDVDSPLRGEGWKTADLLPAWMPRQELRKGLWSCALRTSSALASFQIDERGLLADLASRLTQARAAFEELAKSKAPEDAVRADDAALLALAIRSRRIAVLQEQDRLQARSNEFHDLMKDPSVERACALLDQAGQDGIIFEALDLAWEFDVAEAAHEDTDRLYAWALARAREALERRPNNVEAAATLLMVHRHWAQTLAGQERFEESLARTRELLALIAAPKTPFRTPVERALELVHENHLLGNVLIRRGLLEEAAEVVLSVKKLLETEPLAKLAVVEPRSEFEETIDLDVARRTTVGRLLALRCIVLRTEPSDPNVALEMGSVLRSAGRAADALAAFRRALDDLGAKPSRDAMYTAAALAAVAHGSADEASRPDARKRALAWTARWYELARADARANPLGGNDARDQVMAVMFTAEEFASLRELPEFQKLFD